MGNTNKKNHTDANQAIFQFLINTPTNDTRLKSIPPIVILTFFGYPHEEPNVFLFEFEILCRIYDYIIDPYKCKLFPFTMKAHAFRWFMGLVNKGVAP